MEIVPLLFFIVLLYCLGYTATSFVKKPEPFELYLVHFMIGLAVLPILTVLLNLFRIPISWWILLFIAIIKPAWDVSKLIRPKSIQSLTLQRINWNLSTIIIILLFIITFYMYHKGAFSYPYLEDDDPWGHAVAMKYIALERDLFQPNIFLPKEFDPNNRLRQELGYFHYLDPYPPGYDVIFGILHQLSSSLNWTIKFFNALIISLGIIFFYLFAKEFTQSTKLALAAAFALFSIPSYLTHFIWAHALIPTLMFPAFYAMERIKTDKNWWIIAALATGSMLVIQTDQSIKFGAFFIIYGLVTLFFSKKTAIYTIGAGLIGLVLSMAWWGALIARYGGISNLALKLGYGNRGLNIAGTADRAYTVSDFFIAKSQNLINNPTGIGIALSILALVGLIAIFLQKKPWKDSQWAIITLGWLLLTLFLVNGARFPIRLFPFRSWMLLAIPISLLAGLGILFILNVFSDKKLKIGILTLIIIAVFFTSFVQKYAVNTAQWSPGGSWNSNEELSAYLSLLQLPPEARVVTLARSNHESHLIGLDKLICTYCDDEFDFRENIENKTTLEIYSFFKGKWYEYVILDAEYAKIYGMNATNQRLKKMAEGDLFTPILQTQGMVLFKIN